MRKGNCQNFLKNATDDDQLRSPVLKKYHLLQLPFSDHLIENYNIPILSLNDRLSVHPLLPAIPLNN